jgi:hypothetical protein
MRDILDKKMLQLMCKYTRELYMTSNEVTALHWVLGVSSEEPDPHYKGSWSKERFKTYLINTFQPLLRDLTPNEFAAL